MRTSLHSLKIVIIFCISLASEGMHAQLGFCQGNSGDPIFTEDFGSGTNYGPALPAGTTTYSFIGNSGPQDGEYTIGRNTFSYGWNLPSDHTGDTNGKALIVNANFTTGEFYTIAVNGLCENTTYEFSSWLINILPSSGCGGNGIPVNVQFEIWDITDTNLLASGDTGNIFSSNTPTWQQYGLVFQTLPSQTSIILKMINNGEGGCGNDLAIDDIVFKSCGDLIAVQDSINNNAVTICSSQGPFSETITAIPDNAVFSSHFYQWQSSTDGINWTDVTGETNASIVVTAITTTTYYRTKVAEYAANLSNSDCLTFSDIYEINVNQAPPPPTIECWETSTFDDLTCSWIITGTQPPEPTGLECWKTTTFNNITCSWDITGTQPVQPTTECWETATFDDVSCSWILSGTQPSQPTIECWETATFNNTTCIWDITGTQPAQPTTECWETAMFNNTTCEWETSGTQPTQPTIECWETATFNTTNCDWDVSGTQPVEPTELECWQTTSFNNTTCSWEVIGSQPIQPTVECWEVTTFNSTICTWETTGTQPAEPTGLECWETANFNSITCTWDVTGTEPEEPTELLCWQTAVFNETICEWEINGAQPLEFRNEYLFLCEDEELTLDAISFIENPTYQWQSGELSQMITIDAAGIYEVEVTDGCFTEIISFNVSLVENPVIESIVSDSSAIIVSLSSMGNYLYSLDGINYQSSNIFSNSSGGLYIVYIKSNECNVVITQEHFHFFIQKFMTPNNDGMNDFFSLKIAEYFESTEVYIFNRYGKVLYTAINTDVNWDGRFNNSELPTSDYWYRIVLDGKEFKGHFTLKR